MFNVLVLGQNNVGKSSLIENLSGVNIFPQDEEIFKLSLNLKLINKKNKNENPKESIEKLEDINENSIVINNSSFYSWENFHEFLKENRKNLKDSDKLKVKLVKDNSNLSFNYNFTEIHDKFLLAGNKDDSGMIPLLLDDLNCIFLVCVNAKDYKKEITKYEEIISKNNANNIRTIFVLNKVNYHIK